MGSVRIPSSSGAPVLAVNAPASRSNTVVPVFEDNRENLHDVAIGPVSILTAVKRQDVAKENALKPGAWTTVPVKKHCNTNKTPSFTGKC